VRKKKEGISKVDEDERGKSEESAAYRPGGIKQGGKQGEGWACREHRLLSNSRGVSTKDEEKHQRYLRKIA